MLSILPILALCAPCQNLTVAIIGGGPSGLVCAKEARACGLNPMIFEQSSDFGGVWNPDTGKVWEGMHINNSRYSMVFSDHAWPEETEDFPTQKAVYEYLRSYAARFGLHQCAQFNARVTRVEKFCNKWQIEWIDANHRILSSLFDSVIVCSGVFSKPFVPDISGLETFRGVTTHSQDYKSPAPFKDSRVVVVGNAFSGCEIAAEISTEASGTFHIFRSTNWLFGRYLKLEGGHRIPFDWTWRRETHTGKEKMTPSQINKRAHSRYSMWCKEAMESSPDLAVLRDPETPQYIATISDLYPSQIKKKRIQTELGSIERIEGSTLYLSNGKKIEADHLLFATGYRLDLPFFQEDLKQLLDFDGSDPLQPLPLYKRTFHPDLPNMAFVGVSRFPIFFTIVELQARWVCLTLSHQLPRPSEEIMRAGIEGEKSLRTESFKPQALSLNGLACYEDLAREINALPDFESLAKEDPCLYQKLWNGPFTSASYRLVGPGSDPSTALKQIDALYRLAPPHFNIIDCDYSLSQTSPKSDEAIF